MTLPAALPGAALRVMRTAAGRRALQVVLLVGGLFALGFLCGEQAHAADGNVSTTPTKVVQSAKSSVEQSAEQVVEPTVDRTSKSLRTSKGLTKGSAHPAATEPVTSGASAPEAGSIPSSTRPRVTGTIRPVVHPAADNVVHPAADNVVHPAADNVVHPAADNVVRPVGDLAETVTGGLAEAPPEVLPSLPGLPGPPTLPGAGGQTPPADSAPQPSGGVAVRPGATVEHDAGRQSAVGPVGRTSAFGPSVRGTDTYIDGVAVRRGDGVQAGPAPAHQAPPGDPTGELGKQSAVDNGTPRHGDPHAVTSNHRAPLRLVPGASAVVTAAETRDRFRDIPVFPG